MPVVRRRSVVSIVVLAGVSAITSMALPTAGHALRHLRLTRSFPAADTVLASSPDAVRLWLSEAAEMPATKLALTNSKGAAVALARATRAAGKEAPIVATLVKPVPAGTYNVSWRTMSRDGHVVKGAFAFRVMAHSR